MVLPVSCAKSTLLVPQQPRNTYYVSGLGFLHGVNNHGAQLVAVKFDASPLRTFQGNSPLVGAGMSNAVPTYTLIVVSHADLRRHEYASELINIPNYKQWKRPYHECIFTPSGTEDIDSQMQQVNSSIKPCDDNSRLYVDMPTSSPWSTNYIPAKLSMFILSLNATVLQGHPILRGLQFKLQTLNLNSSMYLLLSLARKDIHSYS